MRAEGLVPHVELGDGGADRRHGSGEVVADDLGLQLAARGHPAHEMPYRVDRGRVDRTKTPSSGTTGVSISATFNRSAGPDVSLRTALIPTQFKLNGGYWSVMSVNA